MKKAKPTKTRPDAAKKAAEIDAEARIRQRAYELWEQNGCVHGHDLAHWLQARQEILGNPDAKQFPD